MVEFFIQTLSFLSISKIKPNTFCILMFLISLKNSYFLTFFIISPPKILVFALKVLVLSKEDFIPTRVFFLCMHLFEPWLFLSIFFLLNFQTFSDWLSYKKNYVYNMSCAFITSCRLLNECKIFRDFYLNPVKASRWVITSTCKKARSSNARWNI